MPQSQTETSKPRAERASVRPLSTLRRRDVAIAGGKGASLGELIANGIDVPPGFVVTAQAYLDALERGGVRTKIIDRLRQLDPGDPASLTAASDELREMVRRAGIPDALRAEIIRAYRELGNNCRVAVRSSPTIDDPSGTASAGMTDTFTNIVGDEAVLAAVLRAWMSLWSRRIVAYRASRGLTDEPSIAVVVELLIDSDRAGVMFTGDPATGERDHVVIEAAYGLGESVVRGLVEPDTYVVDRKSGAVVSARVGSKSIEIVRDASGQQVQLEVQPERRRERALSDDEARALAKLGARIEAHYGAPQDVEWVLARGAMWITQSRPIPTTHDGDRGAGGVLLTGLGAAPGRATGRVRIALSLEDAGLLETGEVLVTNMTSADWLPTIRRAAALVIDGGGMTSQAAVASRELRIPCVALTRDATRFLRDGEVVTVDGGAGRVLAGEVAFASAIVDGGAREAVGGAEPVSLGQAFGTERVAMPERGATFAISAVEPIATKLFVSLATAERVEELAAMPVDGVGLLRAEVMLFEALAGAHPRAIIASGRTQELVSAMTESVLRVARAFAPRPVLYRAYDFRTNELRALEGGAAWEPDEENPTIGYRGCFRYVKDPAIFAMELDVLARVREQSPNVHVMIPFVRTLWELEACLERIDAHPLGRSRGLQRWVMAEVPSIVFRLPQYAKLGVHGVSIGTSDLAQLMLGVDRESEVCAELYDEQDAAVLDAIRRILESARACGLKSSLCGQTRTTHPELTEQLVRSGIDSISVAPDELGAARLAIGRAERALMIEAARRPA